MNTFNPFDSFNNPFSSINSSLSNIFQKIGQSVISLFDSINNEIKQFQPIGKTIILPITDPLSQGFETIDKLVTSLSDKIESDIHKVIDLGILVSDKINSQLGKNIGNIFEDTCGVANAVYANISSILPATPLLLAAAVVVGFILVKL